MNRAPGVLDRMRLHKLPEAWIAPPPVRELRELVRYRHKVVCLRTGLKAQVKALLAKHGLHPPVNDLWGRSGTAYLNSLELGETITGGHGGPKLKADYRRIAARRGTHIARVAVARKLLTLVYFGLRDGEVRAALPSPPRWREPDRTQPRREFA
jgi:hypothetical protein